MIKFFKGVNAEMRRVHWPSAKENRHDTGVVVTVSILFALFLGALDWLFSTLIRLFM
ncbi:MAG: preprotein translocase subunit SecE [Lactobacillus sp.]|jgi:preprotein translocase subunit SecE|nr:preprotein translocase subunit SecE [Lactobacillus sp.]MCH3905931.1 preprotein translocase subunit SecE [Lactobacillus sp.]MCH3990495.1 preprotein translocase subunit SecE [Lactobacillus sp.]MCH4068790.1 preprotein translocase subunit SecE [Lactobacillus sp.]MCI1303725.1 preprotein translocase subunit SecE [Lactobacillus sp.]